MTLAYATQETRASTPIELLLQTRLEHHYLALTHMILPRGRSLVVSGYSQSLKLTGLDKSLPSV